MSMNVRIEGRSLTKVFEGRQRVDAVADVSLTIRAGETLGLVGESGAGKSTVGRLLAGLAKPTAGVVEWNGIDLRTLRGSAWRAARRSVQVVFQDPISSLNPRHTVARTLGEAIRVAGTGDRRELPREIDMLLERVGLDPSLRERRPAALSGGQAQRIALARALALDPSVLVLDEPFSALDAVSTARLADLLLDLQASGRLSYLFITHDLGLLGHLADRIAVMRSGRIVETAEAPDLFRSPAHDYTRALLEAVPGQRRLAAASSRAEGESAVEGAATVH